MWQFSTLPRILVLITLPTSDCRSIGYHVQHMILHQKLFPVFMMRGNDIILQETIILSIINTYLLVMVQLEIQNNLQVGIS